MNKLYILYGILIAAVVLVASSVFIVDEREKVLVLQFGQVRDVREDPGLAFKLPFIQEVVRFDDRILSLETESLEVTPADDRRLVVDAFARYRITDPVQFRQAVGSIAAAEDRIGRSLNAALRNVLGGVTSNDVLSADRVLLMAQIRDNVFAQVGGLGVEVIDVRIRRAELPQQNLAATFARMQAEREREAADERARGAEAAQRVRAQADRTKVELVSAAQRDSEIIRGEADAQRNAIFAEAFGQDPEFFEFYRSLNAYEIAMTGDNATLVISPDSEFFSYFNSSTGAGAARLTMPAATEATPMATEVPAEAPAETAPVAPAQ
ncbi:MAG: protease modulator HflC [Paracoccaceae bacterium]